MKKEIIAAIAITLTSNVSHAICKQSDNAGRWDGIVSFTDGTGKFMAAKCQYNYDTAGNLSNGWCMYPNGAKSTLVSGTITLSGDCVMTGTVLDNNNVTINLNANMSRGKDSGVGVYWTNNGLYGTYSAVRY